MIGRQIKQHLTERLAAYPAVTLIGPRQCGKGLSVRLINVLLVFVMSLSASALADERADVRKMLGANFEDARIVAVRDRQIVTVRLADGKVSTLAKFPKAKRFEGLSRPWWSPEGKEILFSFNARAFVMNADGAGRRRILQKEPKVFEPVWWIDPASGERCIVFQTTNGKHWYKRGRSGPGKTHLYRPKAGKKTKLADFPCDGGLSLDGTHLGEAYGGCLMVDIPAGKVHILYNGKQACNASMSPDNTYRLMHLYLPHKHFGIRNKFDKELWRIGCPRGSEEWQDPRWSNHPNFCMATAKYKDGYKMLLVRIDTKKSVVLDTLGSGWSAPHLFLASAAARQATASPGGQAKAAKFPDGRLLWVNGSRIFFTCCGDWKPTLVTPRGYKEQRPRWSPDGKRIVFVRTSGPGGKGVWLMNTDFSERRRILPDANCCDFTGDGDAVTAIAADGYRVLRYDLVSGKVTTLYDAREKPYNGLKLSQTAQLRAGGRYLLAFTEGRGHAAFIVDLQKRRYIDNRRFAGGDCGPTWTPDGSYVLSTARGWLRKRGGRPVVKADFDAGHGTLGESTYLVGNGWCHFVQISNDRRWVLYGQKDKPGRRIYCWRLGSNSSKAFALPIAQGSDDTFPSLYVDAAVPKRANRPVGPLDKLPLKTLADCKKEAAVALCYTPMLRRLAKTKDPEAVLIVKTLENLGKARLADAHAQADAFQARAIYREIATRFAAHPLGDKAKAGLASKRMEHRLAAAPKMQELQELAERLVAIKGAKSLYDEKAFFQRNKAILVRMVKLASELRKDYADTPAAAAATEIARCFGLPRATDVAGNETLTVIATIEAVSAVPEPETMLYSDLLTYIRYKVDKVVSGRYANSRIIVVHWGIRNRKLCPASKWKLGMKQQLKLDLFGSHENLEKLNVANDADVMDLQPYWALSATQDSSRPSGDVRLLTGARTRIVWVQDRSPASNDTGAKKNKLRLMGFDTKDGKGERAILAKLSNYAKPLLTPDGKRIIFSDRIARKVYIVNFDGTGLKEVIAGFAVDVWADPKTGHWWVYVQTGGSDRKNQSPIYRHRLDKPKVRELAWNRTVARADNFQLSHDGTRAAGLFPWPNGGVAVLPNVSWEKLGRGCWTSLSPDNSYLFWIFDGPHRNVYLSAPGRTGNWKVNINSAAGINGYEVYHPRWSNHVRVMAMTGPYTVGKKKNKIGGGGKEVEIFLGRFNDEFTAIEKWARISHNKQGDFFPDAWVEGGEKVSAAAIMKRAEQKMLRRITGGPAKKYDSWPGNHEALVFLWENLSKTNTITQTNGKDARICSTALRGLARFGRHHDMLTAGGAMLARDVDKRLLAACKKTNQLTIEVTLTPADLKQRGPARIVTFSTNSGSRNFTLGQEAGNLVLRLRTTQTGNNGTKPQVTLCKLVAGRPQHVIVSYFPGRLLCYVNGRKVLASAAVQGDFSNWSSQHLLFGDEWDGQRDWSGRLEGVAIYSRFVPPDEAALRYRLYVARFKKRKPAPRVVLEGKLVATTAMPALGDIAPYRRGLVLYTYEVAKVISGRCKEKRIQVAHWAILDEKVLKSLAAKVKERTYRLTLERYDDHPQLQGERLITDSNEFDLRRCIDVGPVSP